MTNTSLEKDSEVKTKKQKPAYTNMEYDPIREPLKEKTMEVNN